jgi:hypothetical protein
LTDGTIEDQRRKRYLIELPRASGDMVPLVPMSPVRTMKFSWPDRLPHLLRRRRASPVEIGVRRQAEDWTNP